VTVTNIGQARTPTETTSDLTATFTETTQALFSAGSAADTLKAVVALAVATIDGCDYASIFIGDDNHRTRPVGSDPAAAQVDVVQHQSGQGPALDALAQGGQHYVEDIADETHRDGFGAAAADAGIRSCVTVRLSDDGERAAALCLYAIYPRAFGALDRAKAVILAAMAGLALSAADAQADQSRLRMEEAMDTREMIGQAQGILMEREHISAEHAYGILRRASQHLETRIRDVAQDLVDSGESPQTGPTASEFGRTDGRTGGLDGSEAV
jgi:transcriptional regulator with GAF, ATPase, and Fis domain